MTDIERATEDFLFHCRYERNLSEKTLKAYGIDLAQFRTRLPPAVAELPIGQVDRDSLRTHVRSLAEAYEPRTVRRKIATLKIMFSYLESQDLVTVNPLRKLRIAVKCPKEIPRTIPLQDVRRILRHVHRAKSRCEDGVSARRLRLTRDLAVLELLFATGIRVSELSGLTTGALDLRQNQIQVTGKGNKQRLIPLCSEEVRESLSEYNALRGHSGDSPYFFTNRGGRRLSEQSIRFMLRKHARKAGVRNIVTPHMFRHTVATQLLANGMDIRCIQVILGHSSIMTTQIYAQVADTMRRREMSRRHPRMKMNVRCVNDVPREGAQPPSLRGAPDTFGGDIK